MNIRIVLAALSLAVLTPACAPDASETDQLESGTEGDVDGKSDSTGRYGYYQARQDFRKCVSPICGGWYIHRVNATSTKCADGKYAAECYVASIDLSSANVSVDLSTAVVRGSIKQTTFGSFGKLGTLVASEAWESATSQSASGIFYRVTDSGIRCIKAPCPSLNEAKLNSSAAVRAISGLDFSAVDATDDQITAAWGATSDGDGLLVAGTNHGARPSTLDASQFWIRVTAKPAKTCYVGGCSSQVCSETEGVITTCLWKPEYACYQKYGVCEAQADGNCGWTQTADLVACLP